VQNHWLARRTNHSFHEATLHKGRPIRLSTRGISGPFECMPTHSLWFTAESSDLYATWKTNRVLSSFVLRRHTKVEKQVGGIHRPFPNCSHSEEDLEATELHLLITFALLFFFFPKFFIDFYFVTSIIMSTIDESQLAKWKAYFDPKMFPGDLNIDRSKCKRTVPMQVLNLGMSRTGTACEWQLLN
jgi:hypothetical protein